MACPAVLVDEGAVRRQGLRSPSHEARTALQFTLRGGCVDEVCHGIVTARKYSQAEVDRDPTRLGEGATVIERDRAAGFEQFDLVTQSIGNGHVPAVAPELPVTTARVVMQDDEVTDRLIAAPHQPVVFIRKLRFETAVREELDEPADAGLDEMDAGGFERLEETAREPKGHAVSLPTLAPAAGSEFDQPGGAQRLPIEIVEKRRGSLLLTDVAATKHITVASAVLQRNPPLPARLVRG